MSLWKRLMAGGGPRRTLGVWASAGEDDVRRVGIDGEKLRLAAPRNFAPEVSVAVVADPGVMLRRLNLPPAKPAVTDQLVRQQVAALLPGMDTRLALAWRRDPQSGDVTVAAGPRAALRAGAQASALRDCDMMVPAGLALDAVLTRGTNADDGPAAWAVDCGPMIWLLFYAGGGLVAADTIAVDPRASDGGPGESVEGVFNDLRLGLPAGQRPDALTRVGRDAAPAPEGHPADFGRVVADDLPARTGWSGAGADASAWLATGAALIGRQAHDAEGLDLEEAPAAGATATTAASAAPRRRPGRRAEAPSVSPGRWVAVGLWLLAALAVWGWAVASSGARQTAVVDELGLSRAEIPRLDRGLAVGRYLETSGPSLLAVLDELGQKTGGGGSGRGGGWMVDEVQWTRDAGVTLRGTLRSADALADLARTMATMRTLTGVQVRRQEPGNNDSVTYTIVALPSSKWYGAFVEPPRTQAASAPEPEDPGDSATPTPAAPAPAEPESPGESEVGGEPDPTPAAAAAEENAAEQEPAAEASGPITGIDDPRMKALLAKYPRLRGRAEQMAARGISLSEAQFERMKQSLESRGANQ